MTVGLNPMWFRFCTICVLAVLLGTARSQTAEPVKTEAEMERVRALVDAGALPRRAISEADLTLQKSRLVETLQKTLIKRELTPEELPAMLEAATRLRDLAREQLDRTRRHVEAGALPVNRLGVDIEQADQADRQYELAQARAKLVRELAAMARAESRLTELEEEQLAFVSDGGDPFWDDDIAAVDEAFYETFGVPLPISADGYTALHEALGFDHTGRLDVPVHPDDPEGLFLIELLETWDIPYIAFRSAVPGQSTGPHIHIGPRSNPIAASP